MQPAAAPLMKGVKLQSENRTCSHIFFLGVSDLERALSFYRPLMNCLGIEDKFRDVTRPWAGWQNTGEARPLFLIGAPYNKLPHHNGNGQMVAFIAPNREAVRLAHDLALSHGCNSEGAPKLRPEYHQDYYGAYFRDPDGNKICVVCHNPES